MKNLKVSMKLFVSFGVAVLLIITVGIVGIVGLNGINDAYTKTIDKHAEPLGDAAHVLESIHSLRAEVRWAIIFTGKQEDLRAVEGLLNGWFEKFESSSAEFSKHISVPEYKKMLAEAMSAYQDGFKPAILEILGRAKKGEPAEDLAKIMKIKAKPNADKVASTMAAVIEAKKEMLKEAKREGAARSKADRNAMIILIIVAVGASVFFSVYISDLVAKPVNQLSKLIGEWSNGRLEARLNIRGREDEIGVMAEAADKWVDSLYDLITEDGGKVLKAAAGKDLTRRLKRDYKGEYEAMKDNINTVMQNLDDALEQVRETVLHVASASSQISHGSQSLADGSNKQASSLEEVSTSLEEMSTITKQNASNSNHAKDLAAEAGAAAVEGDTSMKRMSAAIQQIKQSADNTAKIIKSIDDIAFQTNLLALNAAVEAARAGEAGKGFAVVAEEVRNLAMRSADAAKNTADLIEESVRNADSGVKITEEVAKSLSQIVDRTSKVGELISGIASASNEQANGIEQVTASVAQMNEITQQNATNAEESASAVEELNSLTEELEELVNTFRLSGESGGGKHRSGGISDGKRFSPPKPASVADKWGGAAPTHLLPAPKSVNSEEIIPLEDAELQNF